MEELTGVEHELARLRARITALEARLARRSNELRVIQSYACHQDLVMIARVSSGGPFSIDDWAETLQTAAADVEETLAELWDSALPPWTRCAE